MIHIDTSSLCLSPKEYLEESWENQVDTSLNREYVFFLGTPNVNIIRKVMSTVRGPSFGKNANVTWLFRPDISFMGNDRYRTIDQIVWDYCVVNYATFKFITIPPNNLLTADYLIEKGVKLFFCIEKPKPYEQKIFNHFKDNPNDERASMVLVRPSTKTDLSGLEYEDV